MASYFNLVLDTTAPGAVTFALNSGATYTSSVDVTAAISTSDTPTTGYQMKIWGAVDTAFNANIQTTEGASSWISYSTTQAVRLTTGDGSKTVFCKVRDDVWNESAQQSATITLDTTVPVITITGPDVPKISKVSGKNVASFSFSPDTAIVAYKVKVVPSTSSIQSAGTTIATTNGSTNMTGTNVTAGGTVSCTINGTDLEVASTGDGTKIIKVFGQDAAGNWSL